jgi:hypothetical protein
MTNQNIDVTIQQQQYDTRSAQAWAKAGKTEQCVPRYLLAGS